MNLLYKIVIFLIISLWAVQSSAQVETSLRLNEQSIRIGDQTEIEIGVNVPSDHRVVWPGLLDTITTQIEIIRKTALDSTFSADRSSKYFFQRLTITSFDSGFLVIPPITVGYLLPGDTVVQYTETDATLLEVRTIPVNLEADFKDIKDPLAAPFTFREAVPYLLFFLGVVLFVLTALYFWKKRKKAGPVIPISVRPRLPAHQLALQALNDLKAKKLWQTGQVKEYHTELTEILRAYLCSRFNIHAQEYTTFEIMEAIGKVPVNGQSGEKIRQILTLADMVKFARVQPPPAENDNSLLQAIEFIRETYSEVKPSDPVIEKGAVTDDSKGGSKIELKVKENGLQTEKAEEDRKDVE